MLTPEDLAGVIVPIVTPVTQDEQVDFGGLRRVVRHVLGAGVGGVFAMGSTGNFTSFTQQERFQVARAVVDEVRDRVPVLVGCMDSSTRLALRHVRLACEAGADGVILEPPFCFPCTDEEILSHYRIIAEASQVPVIIYNNPGDSKVHIDLELARKLAAIPKTIGIKDSSFDFAAFQAMLFSLDDSGFRVLQGIEALAGPSFLLGAKGAILAFANVMPRLCVQLCEAGVAGRAKETAELQKQLVCAYEILKDYRGNPQSNAHHGRETVSSFFGGLQCALDALGVCSRILTVPYLPPSSEEHERIREILSRADL